LAYGRVALHDGRLARTFQPFLGVNAYPIVTLRDGAATLRTAYVNNFGDYVLPGIPAKSDLIVQAEIESEVAAWPVAASSELSAGGVYAMNLFFRNTAPRMRALNAMANGKPVQQAAPGSKVTLHAVADDPDGDKLQYIWLLPDNTTFTGPDASSQLEWTVPAQKGRFPISVIASDGRGGYSRDSLALTAQTGNTRWSGKVVDTVDDQPVAGAQIDINGRLTTTNTLGAFALNVPVSERYVLTIRKSGVEAPGQKGYGTASFVYTAPISGGRWRLRRAQVFTVDPTQPISVRHERERRCTSTQASKIDWTPYAKPGVFDWQDGRGNSRALDTRKPEAVRNVARMLGRISPKLVAPFGQAAGVGVQIDDKGVDCSRGIQVDIPANALEDPTTKLPPTGKVQIALSTVDLTAPDQMPGDYTLVDSNGKYFGMESFGAGGVEIGAGNIRYNLKPGMPAKMTIPVDGTQVAGGATPPPSIPFLYYDERKGTWYQEGSAVLSGSGSSAVYTASAPHFSNMNADILKDGESCLAVEVDPAAGFSLPLNVEVVMQPSQVAPGVIQVRTLTVESLKSTVIYNLPNFSDIVLTPIIPGTLPDGTSANVPAGVFVVNTGGPQSSAVTPPPANSDGTYYGESGGVPTGPCGSRVTLKKLNPAAIAAGYEYLQGLSFQASNIDEFGSPVADEIESGGFDYYDFADPRELRNSLNQFKSKNRFGQALAAGEVEYDAQYANSGDLGFGRDMHCRRDAASDGQFDYACYVTNYGQPPLFKPDQQDADDILDPTKLPDATVAMEFSRIENPPGPIEFPDNDRAVKFYVYDTKNPDSVPLVKADLDGHGNRPVPQLCMVCHGGQVASVPADPLNPAGPKKGAFADRSDILAMGASFLPFDLHLFNYPSAKPKATQQAAFKNLNVEIVRGVANASGVGAPIVTLIDTWYNASATQLENAVVAGWDPGNPLSNPHRFYRDVFGRTCRTCHITAPFGAITFGSSAEFESQITAVQNRVCSQKVMPHAQRTNDVFWQSLNPSMPGLLELYGQTLPGWSSLDTAQCGLFYQPGGIAPTVFGDQIYRILFNNCTGGGCHSNVGNAKFAVNGDPAATYNQLLNVTANDGVSKYIVPNNSGASLLYQRISTGGAGTRMPKFGADLTATDTDIPADGVNDALEILNWINDGADGP
ncbi:MAG TPA: hypothetical protein VJR89_31630, partial [Polyangiales bacterium]|nr:hypothetical protein [Polyangiales bacterium]